MSRDRRTLLVMEASGHVFRVERRRGPVWYAKYRLGDGRQIQRKIGPAWTERGRPPAGWFTRRGAEDWLRSVLDQARRGTLPGMVRTGASFADAAAEYLRYIEHDRGAQAVDGAGLPLRHRGSPAAGVRISGRRVGDHLGHRALDRDGRPVGSDAQQADRVASRDRARARKVYGLRLNPMAEAEGSLSSGAATS